MTLLGQNPSLNDLYAPISPEFSEFNALLKKELASDDRLIGDIHQHLLKMGGKFLRPAVALLSHKACGKTDKNAIRLAVAIELIHTATLVHDDIIDNSALRRNQPTIFSKWGGEISIVSGDYLYAKAFLLLADLQDPWVNRAFAACAHLMCEGEMKQIEKRNNFLMAEDEYLKIIHQKTAALFQAAAGGGAYFGGADPSLIEKFSRFGFGLGMAFQIVDDCLDLTAQTQHLGKTAGLDIYKNDVTLPLLYLFKDLDTPRRESLLESLKKPETNGLLEEIKCLAIEKKAVERAMMRAKEYVEDALKELADTPESTFKESLLSLGQYCLDRAR